MGDNQHIDCRSGNYPKMSLWQFIKTLFCKGDSVKQKETAISFALFLSENFYSEPAGMWMTSDCKQEVTTEEAFDMFLKPNSSVINDSN